MKTQKIKNPAGWLPRRRTRRAASSLLTEATAVALLRAVAGDETTLTFQRHTNLAGYPLAFYLRHLLATHAAQLRTGVVTVASFVQQPALPAEKEVQP